MRHVEKAKLMLRKWVEFSLDALYECPDRPGLLCYGTGYNGWGIQTHQKGLAAFAVAATSGGVDEKLLEYSLKMLRFMLESHTEGSYTCTDGDKWGHTWISVLGTERVMHAVERLMPHMNKSDKSLLEKVLVSEADWLLDFYNVCADPEAATGNNRPESNIWNGTFLHRVAAMYPKSPRAEEYINKGTAFLVNGISVPGDKTSDVIYGGKPVSQWFVGNNFYDTFALDHHGYLNVGYMVICLSNIAMYYFSCNKMGFKVPDALFHHTEELWRLIKTCISDDGRLVRIGGDTRVRYCYCQDYVLPMLMFVRDALGDEDAEDMEKLLVDIFYTEFSANGDGSFLSDRCSGFKKISPIYYTRLESDKAAVLSMLIDWSGMAKKGGRNIAPLKSWHAPSHGACISNGENRFASWVFSAGEGMMGLCIPRNKSDLAEWKDNLAADIMGCGSINETEVVSRKEVVFDGGFLVSGEVNRISKDFLAEQQKDETVARQSVVFAALPDDGTVVVMQYAKTQNRAYIKSLKGINYNIPNDIYNGFSRKYFYEGGEFAAEKFDGAESVLNTESRWINIGDELGIIAGYADERLNIYRPGERQITIKKGIEKDNLYNDNTKNLSCDVICTKCKPAPHWADRGEVVLDTAAIVVAGATGEETRKISAFSGEGIITHTPHEVRCVVTAGRDGRVYAVLANLSEEMREVRMNEGVSAKNLAEGMVENNFIIPPKSAVVLAIN